MLCDSSNLHKQKLARPKPLASKRAAVNKVGQKNGDVGLLVEYLFCDSRRVHFYNFVYIKNPILIQNLKIGTLRRTCICTFKKYWACHGTLQASIFSCL